MRQRQEQGNETIPVAIPARGELARLEDALRSALVDLTVEAENLDGDLIECLTEMNRMRRLALTKARAQRASLEALLVEHTATA